MIRSITPHQAQALISRGEVEVIDVRDPAEWATGHIPGAKHVPLDRLQASPKKKLPKDGVLFVCAAGVRSQTAARIAQANGLTQIYSLSSGTRGWVNAGLPLERELRRSA